MHNPYGGCDIQGVEVGWVIRRSRWGNGFATEAAREAVRYGFEEVGADHLISIIRPDNQRSIRVAEKIGEKFERPYLVDGVESHVYGIKKSALKPVGGLARQAALLRV